MAIYKCKTHDRFPAMVERQSYARFPGRLLQRIRELFSSGKNEYGKPGGSKDDRKLDRSYGSKYQK